MTPLAGMPSSLVGYLRVLLVWSSIKNPEENVMLRIRWENNQRNMSAQITFRESLKVWSLAQ